MPALLLFLPASTNMKLTCLAVLLATVPFAASLFDDFDPENLGHDCSPASRFHWPTESSLDASDRSRSVTQPDCPTKCCDLSKPRCAGCIRQNVSRGKRRQWLASSCSEQSAETHSRCAVCPTGEALSLSCQTVAGVVLRRTEDWPRSHARSRMSGNL